MRLPRLGGRTRGYARDVYADRADAGRVLAGLLEEDGAVVLALPRGGVPVAAPVAAALGASLDVLVVRKLGAPGQPELAIGALAAGTLVLDTGLVSRLGVTPAQLEAVTAREEVELARREQHYRGGRPPPALTGRTVVLVDDGLATGATLRAAVAAVRVSRPRRVVVAVPVGSVAAVRLLESLTDEVVCPLRPEPFEAVGRWYADFGQTTDEEVVALLDQARSPRPGPRRP
jgi:putative phosphoribosyl transferase